MEYELVHEIQNLCPNNQMRDIFFEEVQTQDPAAYVQARLEGRGTDLVAERRDDGTVCVYVTCDGLKQKFIFTPI